MTTALELTLIDCVCHSLELIVSFIFYFHFLFNEGKAEEIAEINHYNCSAPLEESNHSKSFQLRLHGRTTLCKQALRDAIRVIRPFYFITF